MTLGQAYKRRSKTLLRNTTALTNERKIPIIRKVPRVTIGRGHDQVGPYLRAIAVHRYQQGSVQPRVRQKVYVSERGPRGVGCPRSICLHAKSLQYRHG